MTTARETVSAWAARRHSDATLFDSALRGDPVAFSEVYRRYHTRVFAFCMARLMSAEAASDATQEVFVRLLSADPDSVESPSAWLFGVARHVCIDIARRQQRTLPADNKALEAELDATEATVSAEAQAVSRDEAAAVFLALRRLRPRYRTALVMRELHGLPVAEIAESLGINVGAAYTVLSRARDAFGSAYAEAAGLPAECRRTVELIYRRTGSGISAAEAERVEAHLSGCAACARESRRAGSPSMLGALPLLLGISPGPQGLVHRAVHAFGPDVPALAGTAPVAVSVAERWGALAWTSIGVASASLLLAAAVVVPVNSAVSSAAKRRPEPGSATHLTQPVAVADEATNDDPDEEAVLRRRLAYAVGERAQNGAGAGGAAVRSSETHQHAGTSSAPKRAAGGGGSASVGGEGTSSGTRTQSGVKTSASTGSGSGGAGTPTGSDAQTAGSSGSGAGARGSVGQGVATGGSAGAKNGQPTQ